MRIFNSNEYINEKLNIQPVTKERLVGLKKHEYKFFPKTKQELREMIYERIDKEGNECNLNDIDTSAITDMSYMFGSLNKEFNGNISMWDVSNVVNMTGMFKDSKFNGDIYWWNVSNVKTMESMFNNSKFNQDISKWDVSNVVIMSFMFEESDFNQDISGWNVKSLENMFYMFHKTQFDQDLSKWDIPNTSKKGIPNMFVDCPLEDQKGKWPKL